MYLVLSRHVVAWRRMTHVFVGSVEHVYARVGVHVAGPSSIYSRQKPVELVALEERAAPMQFGAVLTKLLNFSDTLQNQSCAHGANCEDSAFSAIHTPRNMCMVTRTHTRFRLHFGVTAELDPIKKPLTRVPCRWLRRSSNPRATLPII